MLNSTNSVNNGCLSQLRQQGDFCAIAMKTCPQCNATNRDEAKFCGSCGARLEVPPAPAEPTLICPACGAQNKGDAKFCEACGAALVQAPPPPAVAEPVAEPAPAPLEAPEEAPVPPAQPSAEPVPAAAPAPTAVPAELAQCPACGYLVCYCPSCGAPMQRASDAPADQEATPQPQESIGP
ncbi:MAG TPA: zinc-ribbon domain-containing protein [Anaerolineae bacterium]|nr:zinc-ribbon domain-containing protein [Anaerolineae bacterium]